MNMFVYRIDMQCTLTAREELRAEEFTKFQAALMWSKKYCDYNPVRSLDGARMRDEI